MTFDRKKYHKEYYLKNKQTILENQRKRKYPPSQNFTIKKGLFVIKFD